MPIPAFDSIRNVLPPHLGNPPDPAHLSPYSCSVEDLCERFAKSARRRQILGGFLKLRTELFDLGVRGFHWLDGSFLEDIESQEARDRRDVDVVTFVADPADAAALHKLIMASNDLSFLQVQSARLRRLLIEAGDDPILVPQLKARLQSVEEELRDLTQPEGTLFPKASTVLPRVALYLKGGGVQDSEGIRPSLAGESLIQYERMFTEQAIHDERVAARQAGRQRRRRGAPHPALLFTGTPRGSFGLEFVPQATEDEALLEVHARALTHIADALARIAEDEAPFEDAVAGISPRVLPAMKKFLSVLAQNGAEVRIAFSGAPARVIGVQQIARAVERLDHEWLAEDITVRGIFRGLTWDSNVFDLNADDMGVITGTLADTLTEEDFERIAALTNKRCLADLQKTTLRPVGGVSRDTYLLLDAKPEE